MNKDKYLKFVTRFRNVDQQSDFFGVSVPTIRKWQILDSKIPLSAIKLIDKENELDNLKSIISKKDSELFNIKGDISSYFYHQNNLKEFVED